MPSPDKQYSVFQHLTAPKAELYRAILRVFAAAKNHFGIALRPREIAGRLFAENTSGFDPATLQPDEISTELRQLRDWGNLDASEDNADVQTADEFKRARFLYQFSAAGEAAEQALAFFDQHVVRPGELQSTALDEIHRTLEELRILFSPASLDEAKAVRALRSLTDRFHQLATRAQSFMRSVQKGILDPAGSVDVFLENKEILFEYLRNFIGRLNLATYRIRESLRAIGQARAGVVASALQAAAQAELADALNPSAAQKAGALALWQSRWDGVQLWFLGTTSQLSQADILRKRALSAIPALLETVRRLNDQRADRSDRAKDFVTLARWFAEAPDDAAAHRLWRAAFALSPSRHLRLNSETLAAWEDGEVAPRTSWADAPPFHISPRLRETGRATSRGPARPVVDRAAERAALKALAEAGQEALREACDMLVSEHPRRLSELPRLSARAVELLLDLIGEALARPETAGDSPVTANSEDGALTITLEPARAARETTISTDSGTLRGPDYRIHIRYLDTPALPALSGAASPSNEA
jgi:uncharacterized protein (TIGR02677 family)